MKLLSLWVVIALAACAHARTATKTQPISAHITSLTDKDNRQKAKVHPAFANAGRQAGVELWRIENFEPVPVPQKDFGKFYKGDSYIVLKTTSDKRNNLSWDIHYWIGSESSQDESGAAAILTVGLDDKFDGKAVQHRETMGHESSMFTGYFQPGLKMSNGTHIGPELKMLKTMGCPKLEPKNMFSVPRTRLDGGSKTEVFKNDFVYLTFVVFRSVFEFIFEHSLVFLFAVILVLALYALYKSYVSPDLYVKELTEVGFDHIQAGHDRGLRILRAQAARRLGNKIPPPYPNGWFAVADAGGLKVGGVVAVDALGQNLCVYRGHDGVARCVDAYCPHLGANLAVGGTVCGNCIECPFHRWRFENGELVSVPGVETVPKGVSIKTWTTVEADGAIWIWHDAEGREPLWLMEDAPELKSWGYRGRNEFTVSCHIQEIPENGADVAHLNAVHSSSLLSSLGEKYPFLLNFIGSHHWTADWSKNQDHTANIKLTHDYKIMKVELFHIDVDVTQIGPGHVRLRLNSALGPVLISQSVTPIAPSLQRVVHRVYSPSYNALLAAVLNRAESHMFERDISIWNNKRYVSAPTYTRTDKCIKSFRSWYNQFYSPHSISFKDSLNNNLDW